MPRIYVEWMKGRTEEQRNLLAEKITEAVIEIGNAKRESVSVVFRETDPDKFYKAGIRYDKLK